MTRDLSLIFLGLFAGLSFAALAWVIALRKRRRQQTDSARNRLERETALERRYRDLVESANDIVYTHDLEGKLTSFNPAGARITGYSPDEVLRMNISQLVAPDQLALAREMTARKIRGEPATLYLLDLITKEGRRVTVEISSRPILEDGKVIGIQGFARDVTERKRSEARAAALSNLGHSLSLTTTVEEAAWIVVDTADKLVGWDACYMHLLTPDLKRVIPVLNYDVVNGKRTEVPWIRADRKAAPMDRKVIEEGAQLILRQTSFQPVPGLVTFGDKTRLSASLMFVPIRHRMKVVGTLSLQSYQPNAYDGESLHMLQSLADLCAGAMDRIRAATALRESEERFAKAFLVSPIPVNITTLKDGRYVEVNDSLLRLLGYSRDEVIGRTSLGLGIFVDPEDRARIVARVLAERSIRDAELKLRRKNGEVRTVLASFELINLGAEVCLIGISYDVTERLHLEGQLRQAQKMEAVGQLAAGIAHDFNNIMTIIQGYSRLVLSTAQLSPDNRESLQQVSIAADRAATLTSQLLTFSRKQVMQSRSVDLNDVVKRVTSMLARLLGAHISLECQYASQLPTIKADVGMVEQLITNLAVNARDAMPNGGRLIINTNCREIDAEYLKQNSEARFGLFVCLTVTDTGCGMESATLSKLFEPFFTTKEVGKGTGLGLATAYGIVKQHEGWIEVASQIGQGSTFSVFFPASAESSSEPVVEDQGIHSAAGGNETILVVEDEPALRRLARRVLERYGYRVLEAETGAKALAVWREHSKEIDLLLTDMVMPEGMNGRELADQLRKEKKHLRVIYTSGYSLEVLGQDFMVQDGVVLLPKPYLPATLVRAVRRCMDSAAF